MVWWKGQILILNLFKGRSGEDEGFWFLVGF